jgi:hypothetical protein
VRDLAVLETLGPKLDAQAIDLGQRLEDPAKGSLSLVEDQLFLRVQLSCPALGRALLDAVLKTVSNSLLQCEVMGDSKDPAGKVGTGSLCLKMTEECEEYLLNNILCIVRLQSHRNGITEKTRSKLVVEMKNLLLKGGYLRSTFHHA